MLNGRAQIHKSFDFVHAKSLFDISMAIKQRFIGEITFFVVFSNVWLGSKTLVYDYDTLFMEHAESNRLLLLRMGYNVSGLFPTDQNPNRYVCVISSSLMHVPITLQPRFCYWL